MDNDRVLRVGTAVDISGVQSGMPQAATLVEQGAGRMVESFDRIRSASQAASRSVLVDWAGRPFEPAAASAEAMRQSVDQSTDRLKALGDALKGAKQQSEETGSSWEGFAEKIKGFVEHPLDSAGSAIKGMLLELGTAGAIATGVAAGFAVLGKEAFDLVNEEGLAARQTQNFANMLGLGYEQTKKLGEMAHLVDADIGGLARASFRLAEALDDPNGAGKKQAEMLATLGINAKDSGDALLQVLEKLAEIPDRTKRIDDAHVLLGRASFQLQPLIENYQRLGEVVEQLGGQLSDSAVKSLLDAREKVNELSIAWDHLKEQLASKLSGVVTVVIQTTTKAVSKPSSLFDLSGLGAKADEMEAAAAAKEQADAKKVPQFQSAVGGEGMHLVGGREDAIAQHAKSLDGLKEQLEKTTKSAKDLWEQIEAPPKSGGTPMNQLLERHAAAEKQILDLKERIKAAEKEQSGTGVAERAAAAEREIENEKKIQLLRVTLAEQAAKQKRALGLSTIEAETAALVAAENQRYQIELDAANRINALKAQVAAAEHKPAGPGISTGALGLEHQQRLGTITGHGAEEEKKEDETAQHIEEIWVEHQKKTAEKSLEIVEKTIADAKKDNEKIAEINAQTQMAHAARVYERDKELIEADFEAKRISIQEKIRLLKEQELQEYKTQMAAASGEYQTAVKDHGADSVQAAQAQAKIQELADRYSVTLGGLNAQAQHAAATMQNTFRAAIGNITTAFDRGFAQWTEGHKRFGQAMTQTFRGMADTAIQNVERMIVQMLAAFAIEKALGQKSAMSKAYQSAANTWRNVTASGIGGPFNPAIAAAEAAGVFAAVAALGSYDIGGVVPKTGVKMVHEGERVLTERQNTTFERMVQGGSTGPQYHYHAAEGESPDNVTRGAATFQRWMRDGRLARFA